MAKGSKNIIDSTIAHYTNKYASQWLENVDPNTICASLSGGAANLSLHDVAIRNTILNDLIPGLCVCRGVLGGFRLHLPWADYVMKRRSSAARTEIEIENVFILATVSTDNVSGSEAMQARAAAEELRKRLSHLGDLDALALAELAGADDTEDGPPSGLMQRIITMAAANLHVTVRNVHVRIETTGAAAGLVLRELAVCSTDRAGSPTTVTVVKNADGGSEVAPEFKDEHGRLFKNATVAGLAVYADTVYPALTPLAVAATESASVLEAAAPKHRAVAAAAAAAAQEAWASCMRECVPPKSASTYYANRDATVGYAHEYLLHPVWCTCRVRLALDPRTLPPGVPAVELEADLPEVRVGANSAQVAALTAALMPLSGFGTFSGHRALRPTTHPREMGGMESVGDRQRVASAWIRYAGKSVMLQQNRLTDISRRSFVKQVHILAEQERYRNAYLTVLHCPGHLPLTDAALEAAATVVRAWDNDPSVPLAWLTRARRLAWRELTAALAAFRAKGGDTDLWLTAHEKGVWAKWTKAAAAAPALKPSERFALLETVTPHAGGAKALHTAGTVAVGAVMASLSLSASTGQPLQPTVNKVFTEHCVQMAGSVSTHTQIARAAMVRTYVAGSMNGCSVKTKLSIGDINITNAGVPTDSPFSKCLTRSQSQAVALSEVAYADRWARLLPSMDTDAATLICACHAQPWMTVETHLRGAGQTGQMVATLLPLQVIAGPDLIVALLQFAKAALFTMERRVTVTDNVVSLNMSALSTALSLSMSLHAPRIIFCAAQSMTAPCVVLDAGSISVQSCPRSTEPTCEAYDFYKLRLVGASAYTVATAADILNGTNETIDYIVRPVSAVELLVAQGVQRGVEPPPATAFRIGLRATPINCVVAPASVERLADISLALTPNIDSEKIAADMISEAQMKSRGQVNLAQSYSDFSYKMQNMRNITEKLGIHRTREPFCELAFVFSGISIDIIAPTTPQPVLSLAFADTFGGIGVWGGRVEAHMHARTCVVRSPCCSGIASLIGCSIDSSGRDVVDSLIGCDNAQITNAVNYLIPQETLCDDIDRPCLFYLQPDEFKHTSVAAEVRKLVIDFSETADKYIDTDLMLGGFHLVISPTTLCHIISYADYITSTMTSINQRMRAPVVRALARQGWELSGVGKAVPLSTTAPVQRTTEATISPRHRLFNSALKSRGITGHDLANALIDDRSPVEPQDRVSEMCGSVALAVLRVSFVDAAAQTHRWSVGTLHNIHASADVAGFDLVAGLSLESMQLCDTRHTDTPIISTTASEGKYLTTSLAMRCPTASRWQGVAVDVNVALAGTTSVVFDASFFMLFKTMGSVVESCAGDLRERTDGMVNRGVTNAAQKLALKPSYVAFEPVVRVSADIRSPIVYLPRAPCEKCGILLDCGTICVRTGFSRLPYIQHLLLMTTYTLSLDQIRVASYGINSFNSTIASFTCAAVKCTRALPWVADSPLMALDGVPNFGVEVELPSVTGELTAPAMDLITSIVQSNLSNMKPDKQIQQSRTRSIISHQISTAVSMTRQHFDRLATSNSDQLIFRRFAAVEVRGADVVLTLRGDRSGGQREFGVLTFAGMKVSMEMCNTRNIQTDISLGYLEIECTDRFCSNICTEFKTVGQFGARNDNVNAITISVSLVGNNVSADVVVSHGSLLLNDSFMLSLARMLFGPCCLPPFVLRDPNYNLVFRAGLNGPRHDLPVLHETALFDDDDLDDEPVSFAVAMASQPAHTAPAKSEVTVSFSLVSQLLSVSLVDNPTTVSSSIYRVESSIAADGTLALGTSDLGVNFACNNVRIFEGQLAVPDAPVSSIFGPARMKVNASMVSSSTAVMDDVCELEEGESTTAETTTPLDEVGAPTRMVLERVCEVSASLIDGAAINVSLMQLGQVLQYLHRVQADASDIIDHIRHRNVPKMGISNIPTDVYCIDDLNTLSPGVSTPTGTMRLDTTDIPSETQSVHGIAASRQTGFRVNFDAKGLSVVLSDAPPGAVSNNALPIFKFNADNIRTKLFGTESTFDLRFVANASASAFNSRASAYEPFLEPTVLDMSMVKRETVIVTLDVPAVLLSLTSHSLLSLIAAADRFSASMPPAHQHTAAPASLDAPATASQNANIMDLSLPPPDLPVSAEHVAGTPEQSETGMTCYTEDMMYATTTNDTSVEVPVQVAAPVHEPASPASVDVHRSLEYSNYLLVNHTGAYLRAILLLSTAATGEAVATDRRSGTSYGRRCLCAPDAPPTPIQVPSLARINDTLFISVEMPGYFATDPITISLSRPLHVTMTPRGAAAKTTPPLTLVLRVVQVGCVRHICVESLYAVRNETALDLTLEFYDAHIPARPPVTKTVATGQTAHCPCYFESAPMCKVTSPGATVGETMALAATAHAGKTGLQIKDCMKRHANLGKTTYEDVFSGNKAQWGHSAELVTGYERVKESPMAVVATDHVSHGAITHSSRSDDAPLQRRYLHCVESELVLPDATPPPCTNPAQAHATAHTHVLHAPYTVRNHHPNPIVVMYRSMKQPESAGFSRVTLAAGEKKPLYSVSHDDMVMIGGGEKMVGTYQTQVDLRPVSPEVLVGYTTTTCEQLGGKVAWGMETTLRPDGGVEVDFYPPYSVHNTLSVPIEVKIGDYTRIIRPGEQGGLPFVKLPKDIDTHVRETTAYATIRTVDTAGQNAGEWSDRLQLQSRAPSALRLQGRGLHHMVSVYSEAKTAFTHNIAVGPLCTFQSHAPVELLLKIGGSDRNVVSLLPGVTMALPAFTTIESPTVQYALPSDAPVFTPPAPLDTPFEGIYTLSESRYLRVMTTVNDGQAVVGVHVFNPQAPITYAACMALVLPYAVTNRTTAWLGLRQVIDDTDTAGAGAGAGGDAVTKHTTVSVPAGKRTGFALEDPTRDAVMEVVDERGTVLGTINLCELTAQPVVPPKNAPEPRIHAVGSVVNGTIVIELRGGRCSRRREGRKGMTSIAGHAKESDLRRLRRRLGITAQEETGSVITRMMIAHFSVSIVDSTPREIAVLNVTDLCVTTVLDRPAIAFSVKLGAVQLDSMDPQSPMPVVFTMVNRVSDSVTVRQILNARQAMTVGNSKCPFMRRIVRAARQTGVFLCRARISAQGSTFVVESFEVCAQEMICNIDSVFAMHALGFATEIVSALSALPPMFRVPVPPPRRLIIQYFIIMPLRIEISVDARAAINHVFSDPALYAMRPLLAPLVVFSSINQGTVSVMSLFFRNKLTQSDLLTKTIINYYKVAVLAQTVRFIGSIDAIGSPAALLSGIGGGVADFFTSPFEAMQAVENGSSRDQAEQFFRGLGRGTCNLLTRVGGSIAGSISGVTDAVSSGLTTISGDERYAAARQVRRREAGKGGLYTLRAVGESIGDGFASAFTGLVAVPKAGFEKGVGEGMLGIAQGIGGLIIKPATGIIDAASNGLLGAKSTASGAAVRPVREPRFFSDGLIMPLAVSASQ